MIKKNLFAIFLAVLGSLAALSIVYAQENLIKGQGKWAVSRIADSRSNTPPYCALARPFENAAVITLAKNATQEYSFALDFQKDVLNPDQDYRLQLKAGGVTRSFSLMPISEKAVVTRLGWDKDFFAALRQNKMLSATLDQDSYRFDFSDFEQGYQELSSCVSGLNNTVAQNDSAETVKAPSREDLLAVENTSKPGFSSMKQTDLEIVREGTTTTIRLAKKDKEKLSDKKLAGQNQSAETRQVKAAPVPQVKEVASQASTKTAPKATPKAKTAPQAVSSSSNLKNELDDLKRQNYQLQQALQRERREFQNKFMESAKANTAAEIKEKMALKEIENKELEENLYLESKKRADALKRIALLEAELEKVMNDKKAISENQAQIEDNAKQMQNLARELKAAQDNLAQKQVQLSTLEAELAQERQALSAAEQKISAKEVAQAQEQQSLEQTLTQEQEKLAGALALAKSETATLNEKLKALEQENLGLKEELSNRSDALEQAQAQVKEKAQQVEQAQAAQETAQKTAQAARAAQAALEAQPQQQNDLPAIEILESEKNALLEENKKLLADVQKLNEQMQEMAAIARTRGNQEVAELERALQAAKADNLSLAKEMEEIKNTREEALLSTIAGNWDLEEATRKYNESQREIRRLALELEQQRTSCRQQKAELEEMLFDPAIAEKEQIKKLSALETELEELKGQLVDRNVNNIVTASGASSPVTSVTPVSTNFTRETLSPLPDIKPSAGFKEGGLDRSREAAMTQKLVSQTREIQQLKEQVALKNAQTEAYRNNLQIRAPQASPERASGSQLSAILQNAGLSPDSNIQQAQHPFVQDVPFYVWNKGPLQGNAEIREMGAPRDFVQFINDYIQTRKQACQGDFASVPTNRNEQRRNQIFSAYEMACVTSSQNEAASILFYVQDNLFYAIAHEINANDMDLAMDARDRLATSL